MNNGEGLNNSEKTKSTEQSLLGKLGPGLITGAADDDPSGISTYSTAGAAYGFGFLWTALFSLPLMIAVQLMCARIGLVSGRGLASVLRNFYSRKILWFACTLVLVANTVNIAADLGGMAAAQLLTGLPSIWFIPVFTFVIIGALVFASYRTLASIFKWLTLVLFAYVAAAFLARPDWNEVLRATFTPRISFDKDYLMTLVGILGTTISPYLFFWQAAEEVEEEKAEGKMTVGRRKGASAEELRAARNDVAFGMTVSTIVFYFIILTTGATLFVAGQRDVQTAQQAAEALRPLAGNAAYLLFAFGLIGTGFLGVPVLAGSAAYAVVGAAMIAGMSLDYAGFNAIKMLFWSAVLNGVLAPPLIVIILFICNNRRVMGEHINGKTLNILGAIAALVMSAAAIALLVGWLVA